MKIGIFTKPNSKGQVVIAKEIRDALGINENTTLNMSLVGGMIYIGVVKEFITSEEGESSYLKLLEKTQGAWAGDAWEETEDKQAKIELKASEARKKA
jgi:AbrB family looped-hinge helix DNA binding protein